MKNSFKIISIALICFIVTHASAQDKNDPAMKAWMEYSTPGEQHKMMAKSTGQWKAEVINLMDPSHPIKSEATVQNQMVLGGRYLTTHYSGDMMGMPFEGTGTIAYDNGTKTYAQTWMDNMGTGIMYMQGKPSSDGRSIEFKGKAYDAMQGKEVMQRQVLTFNSDKEQTLDMYTDMNGKETKMMQIRLTR